MPTEKADDVAALKELFAMRMDHLEERLAEHAEQSRENYQSIEKQFTRAREELHREQSTIAQQTAAAAEGLSIRLGEMNQFRAQLEQERNLYVTRDRLDTAIESIRHQQEAMEHAIDLRFEELSKRVGEVERARANLEGRMTMLASLLLGVSVLINLIIQFAAKIFMGHP